MSDDRWKDDPEAAKPALCSECGKAWAYMLRGGPRLCVRCKPVPASADPPLLEPCRRYVDAPPVSADEIAAFAEELEKR